jgi:hypothetical protein
MGCMSSSYYPERERCLLVLNAVTSTPYSNLPSVSRSLDLIDGLPQSAEDKVNKWIKPSCNCAVGSCYLAYHIFISFIAFDGFS